MIRICHDIWDRAKPERVLCITHAGVFHADEVLATAILERAFHAIDVARVVCLPECIPSGAIVYDTGGGPLDHHQRGGNGQRENGVPYASAGLVWEKYGHRALYGVPCENEIWQNIDISLIQGVDAADNGVSAFVAGPAPMNISQIVSGFNPALSTTPTNDRAFLRAESVMRMVLENAIERAQVEVEAREGIEHDLHSCRDGVLVLRRWVPWKRPLLESSSLKARTAQFVVYPSERGGFNCQAVPTSFESSGFRCLFPVDWRGLSAGELKRVCGIHDALFCHRSGFIAGAESVEGAKALGLLAMDDSVRRAGSRPVRH